MSTLSPSSKVVSLERLSEIVQEARSAGKTIVHCHGVFDPLHIGHIRHFKDARRFGDVLVVTVTPDRFVNKGPHRPVFTEDLRAEAVAALSVVDYVGINAWPTAVETIGLLRPDVFVKGSEFRSGKDITGAIQAEEVAVRAAGGRLEFTDDLVFSASNLVNRHLPVFPPDVVEFLGNFASRHSAEKVIESLRNASGLNVLVLGEAIIDEYRYVEAIGKSSKEPALVVKSLWDEQFVGGAAAVANHVAGFSDRVALHALLGEESPHESFFRERLKPQVQPTFSYRQNSPTIVKRRFIEQYFFSKLFEVYEINDALPTDEDSRRVADALRGRIEPFDLVIVNDYGHGMFTPEIVELVCRESRFLAVNTQADAGNLGFNLVSKYPRADYVTLAENEMRLEMRDRRGALEPMLERLSRTLNCQKLLVTRGGRGSLGYGAEEGFVAAPALATRVVDRLGAGEAVFAVTALCAAQNVPMDVLAFIGSVVGSEAVAIIGNRESIERVRLCRHIEHLLK